MAEQKSAAEIEEWLITELAQRLRIDRAEIALDEPFVRYGADSLTMVTLGGDLEVWLDRSLSPNLLWEYPSVRSLAAYLAAMGEELDDELDSMSEEELKALLGDG